MDITATLNEIKMLSVQERIHLVQVILDSVAAEQIGLELTDLQKQELDRRIENDDTNSDHLLIWEDVKASIKVP
jgi:putative addiction module component (TIGR02574 family)